MKVRVLGNLNSGQYAQGDVVDLPDDEAKALLEVAAVELLDEAAQLDENTNAADTNNTPSDPPAPAAQDQNADGGSATETPLDNPPETVSTVNPAAGLPESAPTSQDSPSQPVANADPQPAAPEQVPAPAPQPSPEDIAATIASTETPKA